MSILSVQLIERQTVKQLSYNLKLLVRWKIWNSFDKHPDFAESLLLWLVLYISILNSRSLFKVFTQNIVIDQLNHSSIKPLLTVQVMLFKFCPSVAFQAVILKNFTQILQNMILTSVHLKLVCKWTWKL